MTRQKLYALFRKFNYFTRELPGDVDQLGFIAFPEEMPLAKKMAKERTDERTANITPEYAVKLVTVAFDWVYNKSPGVIDLLLTARRAAEIEACRDIRNKSKANRIRAEVNKRYLVIKDKYEFEWDYISLEKGNSSDVYSLSEMVKAVQYAAFNLIGINHGRRKNELIGEGDRPYGLYLGCVRSTNPEFDLKTIDVYIEKGVQDWKTFWCNKLVFDSVRVLEKIYQLLRPLNTPVIDYDNVEEEAREHKLLRIRALTDIDGWAETENWFATLRVSTYNRDSRSFFEHIDPDNGFLSQKSHPNRRLFSCLYYYRYEFAELLPLRDHLVHDSSLSTYTYVTDPDTRQLADSMQIAWKKEQEGLEKVMDEVQSEYFRDVLIQIIRGERVGGRWPRLITKRLKTLSKDVDFLELNDREKATFLTKKMIRKGYKANPKSNGACFAGTNRRSAKLANCYGDEELNPQDADPSTCHGCVHLFTNDNYLAVMEEELVELRDKSKDFRLPISVRLKAEKQAEDLEKMIELEREMSEENQRYLAQNIENWTASGFCND
ncbi:MAG: hypothetical protein JAZ17_11355 [Candidatus Thiodiazotropha endolucinida]|nr:hypothetical protein [Candidatus Thiodiazotropha taylori]MCG8094204.1 hypothetical protein [Candidatus Thiodiazotropha endolucinida]MCG8047670.1 hypothetical protein [Candidatus Thiodiazotropha taylori]MCG8053734.1 hypothetical protein [Candidatus Thiodiazotropha taylori]MCW4315554.1 hypothetical protein [Candidatus Thiodiazotropha taylori]